MSVPVAGVHPSPGQGADTKERREACRVLGAGRRSPGCPGDAQDWLARAGSEAVQSNGGRAEAWGVRAPRGLPMRSEGSQLVAELACV